MSESEKNDGFNPLSVELRGVNLIEAAAGTGKTYSIALLVLRFLLEKRVGLRQMLLVTYTNAAVAELEIRIRKFVREAYRLVHVYIHSDNQTVETEKKIKELVDGLIKQKGKEAVYERLKQALSELDEVAIYTIHSFCQRTLSEFAFETKQLFSVEMLSDLSSLINLAVYDYWRNHVAVLDKEILAVFLNKHLSIDLLRELVEKRLENKLFADAERLVNIPNPFDINHLLQWRQLKEAAERQTQSYEQAVRDNWEQIRQDRHNAGRQQNIKKYIDVDDYTAFAQELTRKYEAGALAQTEFDAFGFLKPNIEHRLAAIREWQAFETQWFVSFLNEAASHIVKRVEQLKHQQSVFSFSDLITQLYKAVENDETGQLKHQLQQKYKVVFIDEFQDTDALQYAIFNRLFAGESSKTVLFYIGDPKQAIYGWRGADLHTYLQAAKQVQERHKMGINYRSIDPLIEAINDFFKNGKCNGKQNNAFCADDIKYYPVKADKTDKKEFCFNQNGEEQTAFDIVSFDKKANKEDLLNNAADEVLTMLHTCKIKNRQVKPSDIAILMRTRNDTKQMKSFLQARGIPAVIVDDQRIIDTVEARDLYFFLYAVLNPSQANIARALYVVYTPFTKTDLQQLNYDNELSYFLKLKTYWQETGIYSLILNFMAHYKVREYLLAEDNLQGQRIYANLLQLAEILNQKMLESAYTPEKLLVWFKKAREGYSKVEAYEQRIENDKEAVQIVTVHHSKGLTYNIVLLPYFNLTAGISGHSSFLEYYDEALQQTVFAYERTEQVQQTYLEQQEQENRRLLYVALTRAAYKCVLYYYPNKKNDHKSILRNFIDEKILEKYQVTPNANRQNLPPYQFRHTYTPLKPLPFSGHIDQTWRLASYSSLDDHLHNEQNFETPDYQTDYDRFVFADLPKGALTGNFLHQLLEDIDFSNPQQWADVLAAKRYQYGALVSAIDNSKFEELLHHVVTAKLETPAGSLALKEIAKEKTFAELEFFYRMQRWDTQEMADYLQQKGYRVQVKKETLEGIMHGFIDLLFEHNGRFYILDWKSNFLGPRVEDYSNDKLQTAMDQSNYHLQYLVYSVFVSRYLAQHLPGFDYERHFGGIFYLFLRGLRSGQTSGVYYHRPEKSLLQKMEKIIVDAG